MIFSNPFMCLSTTEYPEQQYNNDCDNYPMDDMDSVYTHYESKLGKNVPTKNILKGGKANGTRSK